MTPIDINRNDLWQCLAEFRLSSEAGNERLAMELVAETVEGVGLSALRLERLKMAVAEAVLNAIEHGHQYRSDLLVSVKVLTAPHALAVRIKDRGQSGAIPDPPLPDLAAKLAGQQSPRGWGLFLIEQLVDEMHVAADDSHHTIELIVHLEEV